MNNICWLADGLLTGSLLFVTSNRLPTPLPFFSERVWLGPNYCTCALQPLQAATEEWMRASISVALAQWPSAALHTAHTGFWGRRHSCRQL